MLQRTKGETMPSQASVAPVTYPVGRLLLVAGRQLLDGKRDVPLGGRALAILTELAAADGRIVTKDDLISAVWNGAIVEDNALQAQISSLRKALDSEAVRLVTVYARGYRLDSADSLPVPRAMTG
jgi:DNA-binding winged helix-turn-helix (wHTH) protein